MIIGAGCALMIGSLAVGSASVSASVVPHVTPPPCNVSVTAGTGTLASGVIAGVTAGTTKITFDCNISSTSSLDPQFVAEGSLLSAIGTSSVEQAAEADTAPATFTASSTDTGCPAGVAGQCTIAVFTIPSAFTASDSQAQCPPSQTQINAGLYACEVAVASTTLAPIAGASYLVTYNTQATPPSAPTIAVSPSSGVPGTTIKISDATGATGHWWGAALQFAQAAALSTTPEAPPSSCASTSGYGNVPTPLLAVNWFVQGTTTPIAGSATGVTISNDCYDGKTLNAPVLSGTIPVPSSLKLGTTYTGYLCEANLTTYPSNDTNAVGDCGSGLGSKPVDASFTFTAALGPITQAAPLSATTPPGTASSTQLAVTGNTGTVSYVQSSATVTGLSVSPTGLVTGAATLAAGSYTISGTDSDPAGDSGTWTFTLGVGTPQAALTVTSVTGHVGTPLTLTTSGGSGTGAVSYTVASGTASGCAVSGTSLTATSTGTCIVTATKAADSTYLSVSSAATTVTLSVGNGTFKLLTPRAIVASNASSFVLAFHCSVATCRGTVSLTATVRGRFSSGGIVVTRKIDIASVGIAQATNTNKNVRFANTSAFNAYLRFDPNRPTVTAIVVVKSQDLSSIPLGRVSLLK
jgi:hypothetical protein